MHQKDWFMQQIEVGGAALAQIIFNRGRPTYEIVDPDQYTATDLLYSQLMELLADSKISEAEDLLFETMDTQDIDYLLTAFDFYFRLSEYDDDYLEQCNFPRDEIDAGLAEVKKLFGVNSL